MGLMIFFQNFHMRCPEGKKQRCACARALINQPKLILADEPTGALDSKSARMLLECLTDMNEAMGATILMVTHDIFSASYCSRILFLQDGRIFNEILRGKKSRREFLTRLPMWLPFWEVMFPMLYKLAKRNARRSLKDYSIYILTVVISFSLIYAFNMILYSEDIKMLSKMLKTWIMW